MALDAAAALMLAQTRQVALYFRAPEALEHLSIISFSFCHNSVSMRPNTKGSAGVRHLQWIGCCFCRHVSRWDFFQRRSSKIVIRSKIAINPKACNHHVAWKYLMLPVHSSSSIFMKMQHWSNVELTPLLNAR